MSSPFDKGTKAAPASAKPEKGDPFDTIDPTGQVKPGKVGDLFSTPSGASDFRISDFVGELLLIKPTEVIEDMTTEIGTTDAVRADITPLTGDHAGTECPDMLVFQTALKRELRKVLDGPNPFLCARLQMGAKKPGKNAPYIFVGPSEEDVTLARKYLG